MFQAKSHEEEKKEQLEAAVLRLEVLKVRMACLLVQRVLQQKTCRVSCLMV